MVLPGERRSQRQRQGEAREVERIASRREARRCEQADGRGARRWRPACPRRSPDGTADSATGPRPRSRRCRAGAEGSRSRSGSASRPRRAGRRARARAGSRRGRRSRSSRCDSASSATPATAADDGEAPLAAHQSPQNEEPVLRLDRGHQRDEHAGGDAPAAEPAPEERREAGVHDHLHLAERVGLEQRVEAEAERGGQRDRARRDLRPRRAATRGRARGRAAPRRSRSRARRRATRAALSAPCHARRRQSRGRARERAAAPSADR